MKKKLLWMLLAALMFLVACGDDSIEQKPLPEEQTNQQEVNNEQPEELAFTAADFLPFLENTLFVYEEDGEPLEIYFDYVYDNAAQWSAGDADYVEVLIQDETGVWVCYFSKTYDIENLLETHEEEINSMAAEEDKFYIIKNPIEVGATWGDEDDYYVISAIEKTETDSGETYLLTVDNILGDYTYSYTFQKDLGIVEIKYSEDDVLKLTEVIHDAGRLVPVSVYQPYDTDYEHRVSEKTLEHRTNQPVTVFLSEAFIDVESDSFAPLMNPLAEMLALQIDKENDAAIIDFNKEFVSNMNLGSGFESLTLRCISATVMDFTGVDKVTFTIEGDEYSSGHIYLKQGEFYEKDTLFNDFQ